MIGHIILFVGFVLQLWLIGKSFAFERDAKTMQIAKRWNRIRLAATIGIPLPMALAFLTWCFEYELAMAVTMVLMEGIPLALVLGFVLKLIYSVNAD